MKIFTFVLALLLVNVVSFSQAVCPDYFRRNNGNGACPDGQLKLYYTTCPAAAPIIDSVYTNGVKANITFASPDASKCAQLGFIGYCVIGGNMPPASNWKIYYHNPGSSNVFGCLVPEGGVLPIGIKTFTATRNNSTVVLNWQTAFESNARLFEIQKKSGSNFITIGTVAATNNETGSSYSYNENANIKGNAEYRLRLVDKDANSTYSEIRIVKGLSTAFDFTIFPNPATRNTKITVADITGLSTLQVIDNTGRLLKTMSVSAGTTMEINNLQTGVYRLRLITNGAAQSLTKTLTVIQ